MNGGWTAFWEGSYHLYGRRPPLVLAWPVRLTCPATLSPRRWRTSCTILYGDASPQRPRRDVCSPVDVHAGITHVITARDNFLGGAIILPDKCFDGLEYPLANQDRHRHVYGRKKYAHRDVNPLNAKAPSSLVKGRSFSPPKLPKKERRKLSYDDDWGGSVEETEKREAEEREQQIIKERSRYTVSQELLDGVAQANASSAPFYGSQIVRGENNRWILQKMEKPETKKKKKEAAVDPSLLIATDQVPTAGYTYV